MTAAIIAAGLGLSDRIEKYGSYAGLAAVLGLAVLALLYFAQAREVKRLREWAGRAPERAQEVQQRVAGQAAHAASTAAAQRRVVAQPIATQAPHPPAQAPAGPAPATPAGAAAAPAARPTAAPLRASSPTATPPSWTPPPPRSRAERTSGPPPRPRRAPTRTGLIVAGAIAAIGIAVLAVTQLAGGGGTHKANT